MRWVLAAVALAACTPTDGTIAARPPPAAFPATVVRVIDGDTFVAQVGREQRRVRLIGVDAPESVKPDAPVACWGPEAAALLRRLLPGGQPMHASYERGGRTDRFGRDLWDVRLPDGRDAARELLVRGAARALAVRPQTERAEALREVEADARRARRGLWGAPCRGRSFDR